MILDDNILGRVKKRPYTVNHIEAITAHYYKMYDPFVITSL
jgi:hypothetical protein